MHSGPSFGKQIESTPALSSGDQRRLYTLCPIQYLPNRTSQAVMTIGLLVFDPQSQVLLSRLRLDISKIKEIRPYADGEYWKDLPEEFGRWIPMHRMNPARFTEDVESFSNQIQVEEPRSYWSSDPQTQIEKLLWES
jgi:hypothetical protein